ncbi:hypothetical protein [Micromonospora sp. HM5-17]|uniref:hypothetical protein n=1 Tax=Micromonospora sp. HM5-17 TaxID=2487710 RepID=UPI000F4AA150|nr:hypothetical protein [Micromonospora sp. HM5-17]ROT32519.1 hypothetical protein EF879_13475 [Micromonospora sp. HM5-17]
MAPDRTQWSASSAETADRFDRTLLSQCWTDDVEAVRTIADRPGTGLVITARQGGLDDVYRLARHLVEGAGYERPLLLDANRYSGTRRLPATAPFDQDWISRQRELGLPVLTDSGYLASGDESGLITILDQTARLGDAIATLPLHLDWLTTPRGRWQLLRQVRAYGVPVAPVLEHRADPFDARGAVDGLLGLLDCGVPVVLLRSDVSALGALCCGAVAAAVGTRATLRHLTPVPSAPWSGPRNPPKPSVVVPRCLAYKRLGEVGRTRRKHPEVAVWSCDCETCDGKELDWMLRLPPKRQEKLAIQHSLRTLLSLRERLVGPRPEEDRMSWYARCGAASFWLREVGWIRPSALRYWQEAIVPPGRSDSAVPRPRSARPTPALSRSRQTPPSM